MKWALPMLLLVPIAAWLYPEFSYREEYNISFGSSLEDIALNISIDTLNLQGKTDQCRDVRFGWMNQSEEEALSYWFGNWCKRNDTLFWLLMPQVDGNRTIYFYYNSTEASESNASAVFNWTRCFLPFEDSDTTAVDAAGSYNGTYTNISAGDPPLVVTGIFGNSTHFEDANDAINLTQGAMDGLDDLTVEFWVKSTDTAFTVISGANSGQADEFTVMGNDVSGDIYVVVYVKGSSASFQTADLGDGNWHHVAVTRTGGTVEVYVNGTFIGSSSLTTGALTVDSNGLWLGQHQNGVGTFVSGDELIGHLDEFRIYDRALASTEISKRVESGVVYPLGGEQLARLKALTGETQDDAVNITIRQGDTALYTSMGNITCGLAEGVYNVSFSKPLSEDASIAVFEEANFTWPFAASIQFNDSYEGYLPPDVFDVTPIIAANLSGNYSQTKLTIPKKGVHVNSILHCTDWNFTSQNCTVWETATPSDYGFVENSTHFWIYVTEFDGYGGGNSTPNAVVEGIYFNVSEPDEKETVLISANITNPGNGSIENLRVWFNGTDCNGGSYYVGEVFVDVDAGSWSYANKSYEFDMCNHTINVTTDPLGEVAESDESDNWNSTTLDVLSWAYYQGNASATVAVQDSENNTIKEWAPPTTTGNIFFTDLDDDLNFVNLRPLNGTDDLAEADTALGSENFTDSVSDVYDSDDNGSPDTSSYFLVMGKNITEVPVVQTHAGSPWMTGILWDGNDGGDEYDGSQSLVFIVEINSSTLGAFGVNDYEIRVPALLRELVGVNDKVAVFLEVF